MNKNKKAVTLIATLILLTSCSGTSSSVIESSSESSDSTTIDSTYSEDSSEEPSMINPKLQEQLDAIASGFDIDVSVNNEPCGSIILTDEVAIMQSEDSDPEYYLPETIEDTEGNSETYVTQAAYLSLENKVVTDNWYVPWEDVWSNIFNYLSADDFTRLNNEVYYLYLDDLKNESEIEEKAIIQLSMYNATEVSDIVITTNGEQITEIQLNSDDKENAITATVNAIGDQVSTEFWSVEGDSIAEIDNALAALENLDYTVTEEIALWDDEAGDYVIDDTYTSWISIDDATYALDQDGYGYKAWSSGDESGVLYLDNSRFSSGDWYYRADFPGESFHSTIGLVEDWNIASVLFEETETAGRYVLTSNVPVVADLSYFDPYESRLTTSDLTVTVGEDCIVFIAGFDSMQIIVSYTGIGSTDISNSLNGDSAIYTMYMTEYYNSLLNTASQRAESMGSSDTDLWYVAFSYVGLPLYGFNGVQYGNASSFDKVTGATTGYSTHICYEYYSNAYAYFEQYLLRYGYTSSTIYGVGGNSSNTYLAYTYQFDYTYYLTDEDGNYVDEDNNGDNDTATEAHTISIVRIGTYFTDATYSDVQYVYLVTIDLDAATAE